MRVSKIFPLGDTPRTPIRGQGDGAGRQGTKKKKMKGEERVKSEKEKGE